MVSRIKLLSDRDKIGPPKFVSDSIQYEVIMGSFAYGVNKDESDEDIYGFCIPPREIVFPHLAGHIIGFNKQPNKFEQYEKHGVSLNKKEYDLTIYSIIKYFKLCMDNNPNMIDSLFVPRRCIIHISKIGEMVREKRHIFLHKGAWHRYKGYAFSQMHKMRNKSPKGKRRKLIEEYGYDVKFAYHIVRLLNEIEQILIEGDLTLDRNREQLKAIRRGDWSQDQVEKYFYSKEKSLEGLYNKSTLPWGPREDEIKQFTTLPAPPGCNPKRGFQTKTPLCGSLFTAPKLSAN